MPTAEVLPRAVKSNLVGVARRVLAAYDQGLVIPVQKRIGPEDFLYLAVKAVPGLNRRVQAARASAPARTAANDETPLPLAA
jgi:hypothetical protein